MSVCGCGYDFRDTHAKPAEPTMLFVIECSDLDIARSTKCPSNGFGPLRSLAIGDVCRVLLCIAEFIPDRMTGLQVNST
ncbi:MAG: hypothetical protein ACREAC_00735, partial [Blastocatellia bacterium]